MDEQQQLYYYVDLLRRRFRFFLIPFVCVALIAAVFASTTTPLFTSSATILVESQQIPEELVKSTISTLAHQRVRVIQQRVLTRENLLSINQKYSLFGGPGKVLPVTETVQKIRDRLQIVPSTISQSVFNSNDPTAIAFDISFTHERPELAFEVTNELVTLILAEDVRNRTRLASETTKFLEREAEKAQLELAAIDEQVSTFKLANKDALPEKLQFQMAALEKTQGAIISLQREIAAVDEEKRLLEFELNMRGLSSSGDLATELSLPQRVDRIKADLTEKLSIYSESHPNIKVLRQQLKRLTEQMEQSLAEPESSAAKNVALASTDAASKLVAGKMQAYDERRKLLIAQHDAQVKVGDELNAIITRTPEVQSALDVLAREQEGARRYVDQITEKLAQARIGERLEQDHRGERFEVIEQPALPQNPINSNRVKLAILGLGIAIAAGFGGTMAAETLDRSIKGTNDFFQTMKRRPLITIPYIRTKREKRQVRLWLGVGTSAATASACAGLLLVHKFYMPLDIVAAKVISRLL